jgi:two-component system, NtrC family, nitrogen regulation sensor histidine kinase GlnL
LLNKPRFEDVGLVFAENLAMTTDFHQSEVDAERILESMGTAVLVFDSRFRLISINQAGEIMLAHSARHVCGRTVSELVLNAEEMIEQMTDTLASGRVVNQRGCLLELPNAADLRVNCTFTPMTDSAGYSHVLIELRQIDHHLRIEQEERLIMQQQATHELLRGLAHEIKNPLGGLRGAAQLLEREISEAALKEYTQIIISEADRLQSLMDRMLGPNILPSIQQVNIHEVLEHVRELVRVEVGESLCIKHDYDPSLPDLQADRDMLLQSILNIVRNAAQALENDGKITLRTRIRRNFNIGSVKHRLVARIEVIDNGPGIDEELRKHIFYPMITGRSDGSGLGLSIAQALISRHQGLIECNSQPGKTVFTILLPLDGKHEP